MVYVALLRGINVGGKNKINMKQLKETFENRGMVNAVTYINSGNVIFEDSEHSKAEIAEILEKGIHEDFSLEIKVLVLSLKEYDEIMKALPDHWKNDQEMKSDVLFLWEEIDHESVLKKVTVKPEIDRVHYVPGALLWSVDKKDLTKSGSMKLPGTKFYKKMTVRNVNTARKLCDLMKSRDGAERMK